MAVSFQKKQLSDYFTIILLSFPLGGCVDEVVNSQANYQGYKHFHGCYTFAFIYSVNGEGVC